MATPTSTTTTNNDDKEKWIFSVFLPFADQRVIELIASHESTDSRQNNPKSGGNVYSTRTTTATVSDYDDDDDDDDETPSPETKSLLDNSIDTKSMDGSNTIELSTLLHDATNTATAAATIFTDTTGTTGTGTATTTTQPCWKFTNPFGCSFQSNVILRLSYRPSWQSIPEYTKHQQQRTVSKTLGCCCSDNIDTEQIWEIYTTQHIVKTNRRMVTIRGMGKCQAIQVYLKSMTDENAQTIDSMTLPTSSGNNPFSTALKLHQERAKTATFDTSFIPANNNNNDNIIGGNAIPPTSPPTRNTSSASTGRFSASEDSLPPLDDTDYIVVTFAIPMETEIAYDPPLLWKVDIPHPQTCDICLDTITVFDGTVQFQNTTNNNSNNINMNNNNGDDGTLASHAYIQGYQSWSFTGSIYKGQPQPKAALPDMFSRAFNFGGEPPKSPTLILPIVPGKQVPTTTTTTKPMMYQSDFFTCLTTSRDEALDEVGGPAFVCGWLSQHQQYGVISMDKDLKHLEMHASHYAHLVSKRNTTTTNSTTAAKTPTVCTDWAYGQVVAPHHYDEEPMVHYLHAVAAYNEAKPLQNGPLLTGWCSWYHYYENITEANLRSNFARLATMKQKVPTNVAVVDDGYMTAWGDWDSLKPQKFTDMGIVSRDIKAHAMRSGLWLAPFACDKHSKIVKNHPEWIIRNDRGKPANSSNCGKFFYGLDATNPRVREHAFHAVRRAVRDWGFRVLKLDFLYAACLEGNGKYDVSMTRAQAMHLALQTIRDAAGPNVFIIGCGCPIGPGIGYVDGMRISADTGPTWYPAFPLPWWDNSTLPSLRAMIRNSMSRAPMGHRWWHNDPDCLLLGETTSLTDDEVASAASIIAMTCGMMLLSDDLTKVSIPRMRILTKIFPMTGVSAVVLDLHIAKDKGLPSIMRLWCTDRYNSLEDFRKSDSFQRGLRDANYNVEATHFGRQASFNLNDPTHHPNERKRSCIHVAKGLGTWTVLSVSNWADKAQVIDVPVAAIQSSSETGWGSSNNNNNNNNNDVENDNNNNDDNPAVHAFGYHVFSFWSGRYCWISLQDDNNNNSNGGNGNIASTSASGVGVGGNNSNDTNNYGPLHRTLGAHETEIFHIRPVTPGIAQYIGSDLHFSCGYEVLAFDPAITEKNKVSIQLKTEFNRVGHIYVFLPTVGTSHVQVLVAGKAGRWSHVGNTPNEGNIITGSSSSNSGGAGGVSGRSPSPSNLLHCCGIILRVMVVVHADGSEKDGEVIISY